MKKFKIFFFIIIFIFSIFNNSFAEQNLKFADIDLIVKNTNIGKKVLSKLKELDQDNVKKLNIFENDLKKMENEIKVKKNLISENELKKEIDQLNDKLADYNKKKNEMVFRSNG